MSSIQFIVEGQNKLIVAGGWNRKVVVWRDDEESDSLIGSDRCMSGHGEDILSIAYSSEGGGNLLATSGYDGRVLVWNIDPSPHHSPLALTLTFSLTLTRSTTYASIATSPPRVLSSRAARHWLSAASPTRWAGGPEPVTPVLTLTLILSPRPQPRA